MAEKKNKNAEIVKSYISSHHMNLGKIIDGGIVNKFPKTQMISVHEDGFDIFDIESKKIKNVFSYSWDSFSSASVDKMAISTRFMLKGNKDVYVQVEEKEDFLPYLASHDIDITYLKRKWYRKILGFRSGKKRKMVVASLAYLLIIGYVIGFFVPDDGATTSQNDNQTAATAESESQSDSSSSSSNSSSSSSESSVSSSSSSSSQPSSNLPAGLVTATVTDHVDGDTVHVDIDGKDETLRLLLIDTPETHDPNEPVQPFGPEASDYAEKQMPVGSEVGLELGKEGSERDKYDRLLAFIYLPNGKMYNEQVIRQGLARVAYIYEPNTQHLDKLYEAQDYAKSHKKGIWSKSGYVTADGFNTQDKQTETSSSEAASTSSSQSNSVSATGGSENFQNCTELRKKYPEGVPSGHPAYQSKMDRDKDNYACEVSG